MPLWLIALSYLAVLLFKFFREVQKRRLLEQELEIAASIQRSFLPANIERIGAIRIRASLEPAKFVGGDFYDIIRFGDSSVGVLIGDVCGKGVSASLIMAQTISLFRVIARDLRQPDLALSALNTQLSSILVDRFVTAQYLLIREKEGSWEGACAGHVPLLYFQKQSGSLSELVPASGPPLGLSESARYQTHFSHFAPGDAIFMYTDGWIEARNRRNQELGIKKLKEFFQWSAHKDLDAILSDFKLQHQAFCARAELFDDLTAVVLKF
mgnify:CR=1 FL=1